MDWLMERTVHAGMIGTTIGKKKESFTDLDFADDVVLLAEMLSVLVLALEVMDRETHPLGLTINWAKTKIQDLGDQDGANQLQHTTVGGNQVEVVESFTYLGSLIHVSGSSEPEIKRQINIFHETMFTLDKNIWRSSITLETKLRLYNTCILPIFLYGAETWSVTVMLSKKIDALDNWCLRRILNVHWSEFVTNDEIRSRTGQPLLSNTVRSRRLSFFGHLHRTDPSQDHYRGLQACILGPRDDWRRRIGRPRISWLRTVEADLRPMNLGLATSKRRAQDRSALRKLVKTATSMTSSSRRRGLCSLQEED